VAPNIEPQFTDPAVTRAKFQNQANDFNLNLDSYVRRGIFCRRIEYPVVSLLFTAAHLKPPAIVFAVDIDFTNYDFDPPSVKFIDPNTGETLKAGALPCGVFQIGPNGPMNLVQGMPGQDAFLCIPGIREYHQHPAHSGDSWFLYRSRGEGALPFIIEQLYKHSVVAISGYNMQLNIAISGFQMDLGKLPR